MSISTPLVAYDKLESGCATERFAFGKNWQRFLQSLNEEQIAAACDSLCSMLQVPELHGKTFLDVGSGSGLFSLAAMRLGAARVHSFDYDPQSVACAQELKRRFYDDATHWLIEQGSVLDTDYLHRLGTFEIVYSWGVLHHTGEMWNALENVSALVRPGGKLFLALYNDEGLRSKSWKAVKKRYCRNIVWRTLIIAIFGSWFSIKGLTKDVFFLRKNPLLRYRNYKSQRGMSYFTDLLDWLGGYPFEVARIEEAFVFFRQRGFELTNIKTPDQTKGNNEYVFLKRASQQ